MYTKCPKCQTVFRITMEQMRAHNGIVRCGRCDKVFNADQQLFDDIPAPEAQADTAKKPAPSVKKRQPAKAKAAPERASARAKSKASTSAEPVIDVVAAPAPWEDEAARETKTSPSPTRKKLKATDAAATETTPIEEIFFKTRQRGPTSAWWIAGSALLVLTLLAQTVYFYRDTLAASDVLRPQLREWCAVLGCDLRPAASLARIELIQPTSIAPHPKYENLLRLRATMVSRAPAPQSFPLMEITFTDNLGNILARRAFAPSEYLERPVLKQNDMLPHVAVSALLDITNPDGKASGYEINFVASRGQ